MASASCSRAVCKLVLAAVDCCARDEVCSCAARKRSTVARASVVVIDSGNAATVLDVLKVLEVITVASGARSVVVTTIGRTVVVVVDVDVDVDDVVVVNVAGRVTMLAGELVVGETFRRSVVVVVRRDRTVVVDVVVAEGTTVAVGATVVEVVDVVDDVVTALVPPPDEGIGTLFVTDVAASVAASLPAESCTAFASSPPVGSV